MNIKRFVYILGCSIALGISIAACSSDEAENSEDSIRQERKEIALDALTRSTAEGLKDFYVKFTTDVARYVDSDMSFESKNVVVSPLSASMVLGMVANGVENPLRKEILAYLGVNDLSSLNRFSSLLLTEIPKADNLTELGLKNSIWVNTPNVLASEFQKNMEESYKTEIRYDDFLNNADKVAAEINYWCSRSTNGKISGFVDEIDPTAYASFFNALYFRSLWEDELFPAKNTSPGIFHGSKGDKKVEMMKSVAMSDRCWADDEFEYFSLSFGNSTFDIYFLIPNSSMSLAKAAEILTMDKLMEIRRKAVRCHLTVSLPKFNTEGKICLNDALRAGGIPTLEGVADLTMFDRKAEARLKLNQAAAFSIDEKGAAAASVTSADFMNSALIPGQSYTINVDRPFFFFIEEYSTGACVLSGRIVDI